MSSYFLSMNGQIRGHLSEIPGLEDKDGFVLPDNMRRNPPGASFQTSVGQVLEPEPGAIVSRSLLGVADPPLQVVEVQEPALVRLRTLLEKQSFANWHNVEKNLAECKNG